MVCADAALPLHTCAEWAASPSYAAGAFCAGEERITFSAETPRVRDDLLAAATARAVYFADWKSRLPDPVEI